MSEKKPDLQMRICCGCKTAFMGIKKDYYCPECYKKASAQAEAMDNFYSNHGGSRVD